MKVTFLGQSGLLFEKEDFKIIIDPYLSNSVEKINPKNYRRQEINENFLSLKPDCIVFTHNHLDHYDPQTVENFLNKDTNILVLAPSSVWEEVRKIGGDNNYVLFNRSTEWTERNIRFKAVTAFHSDPFAIGVIIDDGNKKYYITGDTLYSEEILSELEENIYAVFLPINGVGNNMNEVDAERFALKSKAKKVIPIHFGMFDNITPQLPKTENRVIPEIWKEIKL